MAIHLGHGNVVQWPPVGVSNRQAVFRDNEVQAGENLANDMTGAR